MVLYESAVTMSGFERSDWMPFRRQRHLHATKGSEPREDGQQDPVTEDEYVKAVPVEVLSSYGPAPRPRQFPLRYVSDCARMLACLVQAGHLDERGSNRAAARLGFRAGVPYERAAAAYQLLVEHRFVYRCNADDWWAERTKPYGGKRVTAFLAMYASQ